MKNKNIIWIIVIILAALGLFVWGRQASETVAGTWQDTQIECLALGHQSAVMHIHPELSISVNGEPEVIPANIGISESCMAEVHTHETNGVIHVESADRNKDFTLGDFFTVWERDLQRDDFEAAVSVNGSEVEDPLSYVLRDQDSITIEYVSKTVEDAEESAENVE